MGSESYGCADTVRRELSGTGQGSGETSVYLNVRADHALYHLLYEGLALFHDDHAVDALGLHGLDQLAGNRIAGYLEHSAGNSVGEVLHEVVVCYTAGYDSQALVLSGDELVAGIVQGIVLEVHLILDELLVADFGVGREQYPLAGILGIGYRLLGQYVLPGLHLGPGVGHTGGDAEQNGDPAFLGKLKCVAYHVVGFLL